ncbi:hypothetical protein QUF64_08990 [Anaerolineales bacterium HSG6]|nr:hypothetical protein [Anaerolineales bacterium HSG6]MDM8530224.1 hypothetical protein [Anaerolineales bacterium HSG25]
MQRLFGILLILLGLSGLLISLCGFYFGYNTIDYIEEAVTQTLKATTQSIDNVSEALELTQASLMAFEDSLGSVEKTIRSANRTLGDSDSLLTEITRIISLEIPTGIEALQRTIPSLAQAAGAIDNTLTTLNDFEVNKEIIGFRLQYDLGIDYDPNVPLEEAVLEIGLNLNNLSEDFRGLEPHLDQTNQNIRQFNRSLTEISRDLQQVRGKLGQASLLVGQSIGRMNQTRTNLGPVQANLHNQMTIAKTVLTILLVWFTIAQTIPFYLGWMLVSGRTFSKP